MRAARVHHAARRRGGGVAARGARAAGRADAAHRRADGPRRGRSGNAGAARGVPAGARKAWMVGGPQCPHRLLALRRPAQIRSQALAKELVALQPDVILAQATPAAAALQRESRTIPIVFVTVSDPIGSGFVASLARPGGNLTGLLHVSRRASPASGWRCSRRSRRASRAPLSWPIPRRPAYDYFLRAAKAVAPSLAIELVPSPVENAADIERVHRVLRARAERRPGRAAGHHDHRPSRSHHRARGPAPLAGGLSRSVSSSRPAVSCPTAPTASTCFGRRRPMSTASCAAPSPPTFRCRRRPSTKRSSTSRPRRRSASTVPPALLVRADEVIE